MRPNEMSEPSLSAALVARARQLLQKGLAIPAHPLALDATRQLDERRQKALTRYYLDAGAGGLAVGVHTTQFAIRETGLYERVQWQLSRKITHGERKLPAGSLQSPLRFHAAVCFKATPGDVPGAIDLALECQ